MTKKTALKGALPVTAMKPRRTGRFDDELGNRIKLRRTELNMSQAELGKTLGVSFQQVQKYEKGTNRVSTGRLQQIATALDVDASFFYEVNSKAREVETLLALDASFSMRLLKAYCSVKNVTVRRGFVSLIESVAAMEAA